MIQPKRQSAAMMALLFFVFTVFPVKKSEAVIPLAVGMVMTAVDAAGTVTAADMLAGAVTALVGGVVMALILSIPGDASNPAMQVRIPTTTNQAATDAVMPPPINAPATATPSPGYYYLNTLAGPRNDTSFFSLCSRLIASSAYYGSQGYQCYDVETVTACVVNDTRECEPYLPSSGLFISETADAGEWLVQTIPGGCPSGYTLNGSTCNLSDQRAAIADNKLDFRRDSAGYLNPDRDAAAASRFADVSGTGARVWGKDSSGNPAVVTTGVNAAGDTTVQVQRQVASSDGQSVVKSDNYIVNNATGAVTALSAASAAGSIGFNASTAVPTVSTGAAVSPSFASSGTGTGEVVFPSDYARAGEAASAANTVKTSVDQLKDKFANSETVDDPTVPDWADNWGSTFNPLKAWSMPGHASSCPTGGFEWNGVSYTMNSHCQLILDHWSGLQTAAVVVWTISAIWILLGA